MTKGSIVLLSPGDRLRLCDGTVFTLRFCTMDASSMPAGKDRVRNIERDVSLSGFEGVSFSYVTQSFSNLYHITERHLGEGGTATVFMAVDRWAMRQVACKIVKLHHSGPEQNVSHHFQTGVQDDLARIAVNTRVDSRTQRLRREVDLLKKLKHVGTMKLCRPSMRH